MTADLGFWSGRRVLVTGDTGFKGAWLALWLLELGADVHGLADGVPTNPSLFELAGLGDDVVHHSADIRDVAAVAGVIAAARPEVVLHLAAQPFVRRSYAEPARTFETNVIGTVNVLDAVRRDPADVRVVVNVTTDKCYRNRGEGRPFTEDDPLGGHDPYSASKAASELVTAAYRSSYFTGDDGPALASARAGNVIGGGDWGEDRLVADVMRAAAAGTPVAIRNPAATRPWQHVLNPLSGYLVLAEALWDRRAEAAAYNFGPAEDDVLPVSDVVARLIGHWGDEVAVTADPGPHPEEAAVLALDSTRARERLGWEPAWGLEAGLAATAAWYRDLASGAAARALTLGQIAAFTASAASGRPDRADSRR